MVGGGQEINDGEAGLIEWGEVLQRFHSDWIVSAASDVVSGTGERVGGRLFDEGSGPSPEISVDQRLHLTMNVRSPRAERLNDWVDAVLGLEVAVAQATAPSQREFPLVITRDLTAAKQWLRDRSADEHRHGLVASAGAKRLRAWGLETGTLLRDAAWADWYLRDRSDVRSSYQLEVPATNFDCQGLELDWVGVCWGNDFVFDGERWRIRAFAGNTWRNVNNIDKRRYVVNSYRVLLTRARRGQVIWLPLPDGTDHTLDPHDFDATADYLLRTGAEWID
jgi:hypothetical protein